VGNSLGPFDDRSSEWQSPFRAIGPTDATIQVRGPDVTSEITSPVVGTSCQLCPLSVVRRSTVEPYHQPSLAELNARFVGATFEILVRSRIASHVRPPSVVLSISADIVLPNDPSTKAKPSSLVGNTSEVTVQLPMKLIELADAEN
jgi:hypothetical protein